jgi:outer membrane protein OmpA-like peptidoglycan-associated protein
MNRKTSLGCTLLTVLLTAAAAVSAQDARQEQAPPSVDSIINSLKADTGGQAPGQTRALRPGAAAMATSAPAPTVAEPKPASINIQINFDFNSDRISPSSEQTMANLAAALMSPQLQNRNFTVIGHTDAKGSDAYNMALSERRAQAVRRYLIEKGVSAARLRAVGKGKTQLLNTADPYAPENRRVEILATGG